MPQRDPGSRREVTEVPLPGSLLASLWRHWASSACWTEGQGLERPQAARIHLPGTERGHLLVGRRARPVRAFPRGPRQQA